ncbi:MAG TPA: ATP-binding protein [Solirubrobacteraceae bacterium]|nr:ATP-binding protein [Solirubrobacteraceae bacterium]
MDARTNPYAPGAGTRPPVLSGRDREIEAYEVLLDRLGHGTAGQSMIVTGLRGVGKTVLLNAFEDIAVGRHWIAAGREFDEQSSFPTAIARSTKRILNELEPVKKAAERVRVLLSGLGTFTLRDPNGFELGYTPRQSLPTEALAEDFTDMLLAVGEAAAARGRGVAFLFDEVQFVPAHELGPFIVGLHRLNQKALPVTCVAAGLPSLPALVGNAKSYAERLFEYPHIDQLPRADAIAALADPARNLGVAWEPAALDYVFAQTGGYPYFLQEYGKYIWDVATNGTITESDARTGGQVAQDRLDEGFFLVRYEHRATNAERAFLHAMARCPGPPYSIADITRALGKDDQRSLSVRRNTMIKKGLIYAPRHGHLDYTVPRFADFLERRGQQ